MIEEFTASNGSKGILYRKKQICSGRNPEREAESWVKDNQGLIEGAASVIILGLGSGHYIGALRKKYPDKNLIVIEKLQELIDFSHRNYSIDLSSTHLMQMTNIEEVYNDNKITSAIKNSFSVLMHPSAKIIDANFYLKAYECLLGRSFYGFEKICEARSISLSEQKINLVPNSPLSFKDILPKMNEETQFRPSFNILSELIR